MLSQTLAITLQLPPLAFGPARPPEAFAMPRALVCELRDLGRINLPAGPPPAVSKYIYPGSLKLSPPTYLVNRPVDLLMFLTAAYAGRATWDDTPWSVRTWQATGAAAPVLVPPQPPPYIPSRPR